MKHLIKRVLLGRAKRLRRQSELSLRAGQVDFAVELLKESHRIARRLEAKR